VLTPFLDNRTRKTLVTPAAGLYHAAAMDEKAIRQSALITLRRAILERFPPGPRAACVAVMASSAPGAPKHQPHSSTCGSAACRHAK
jgi:hypothetical protein